MALVSCDQGCAGQCWASAHLHGKKREVSVQRMCSKPAVVKEIRVLVVDRCWSSVARRDAEDRKPLGQWHRVSSVWYSELTSVILVDLQSTQLCRGTIQHGSWNQIWEMIPC